MANTSLDLFVANMREPVPFMKTGATMRAAGVLHSFWYTAGEPGAASAPTPGINGAALSSTSAQVAGQIPFSNPVSGNTNLAMLCATTTLVGSLYLVDRLWHNSGITITTTTEQAITSPTWPARDRAGATNGLGVMVGLEVSGVLGNGTVTNTTMRYTNSAGTGTRTATIASFPSSASAGTFIPFALAAGDLGVRSIQGLTLGTSYVSGTMHLVAYRILARLGVTTEREASKDLFALGAPRIYNGAVPFLLWRPSAVTAVNIDGAVTWAQG